MYRHNTKEITSARGTASHTPVVPKICGRINNDTTIQINVRVKEMIPDVFPSDNAV